MVIPDQDFIDLHGWSKAASKKKTVDTSEQELCIPISASSKEEYDMLMSFPNECHMTGIQLSFLDLKLTLCLS